MSCVSAPESVRIGIPVPLTGPLAWLGQSGLRGAQLAVDEWNTSGGALWGRPIELIARDAGYHVELAISAVEYLIMEEGTQFVIGPFLLACLPVSQIAEEYGVLMISPTCIDQGLTVNSDGSNKEYVFRVCLPGKDQARRAADFAREELSVNKVAILEPDYGTQIGALFEKAFSELGGEISINASYSEYDSFLSGLTGACNVDADMIFFPSYPRYANNIANQMLAVGFETIIMVCGEDWHLAELIYQELHGFYFISQYAVDDDRPVVSNFRAAFNEKYQMEPDSWAALAYDATHALLMAIDEADTDDPALVKDTLGGLDFEGVCGFTVFDGYGNPIRGMHIYQIDRDDGAVPVDFMFSTRIDYSNPPDGIDDFIFVDEKRGDVDDHRGDGIAEYYKMDWNADGNSEYEREDRNSDGIPKYIRSDANDDKILDYHLVDNDEDGRPEYVMKDPNSDGNPEYVMKDGNSDGRPNEVTRDRDSDGNADFLYLDTDSDGKPEVLKLDRDRNGTFEIRIKVKDASSEDKPTLVSVDTDEDGKIEYHWVDNDADGNPETWSIDWDDTGNADFSWTDANDTGTNAAGDTFATETKRAITLLFDRMKDNDWRIRDRVTISLFFMGDLAKKEVQEAAEGKGPGKDAEVKIRAKKILWYWECRWKFDKLRAQML
jgi:branched-chain amino acid transport system substrate-binding protein